MKTVAEKSNIQNQSRSAANNLFQRKNKNHRGGAASKPGLKFAVTDTTKPEPVQPNTSSGTSSVLQGFFKFTLEEDSYKIKSATYLRSKDILSLIGRIQGKHTTADVAQRPAFEIYFKAGRDIDAAAFNFLTIAGGYTKLPGMQLAQFHLLESKSAHEVEINEGMITAHKKLGELKSSSLKEQEILEKAITAFKSAENPMQKKAAAFDLVTSLQRLVEVTEDLRDLVPLTNLWSKNEKRGKEPEAMKVLEPQETKMLDDPFAEVPEEMHKEMLINMWHLFDFKAIGLLLDEVDESDVEDTVNTYIPWLDWTSFMKAYSNIAKSKLDGMHIIVAYMLAQHIRQMELSFHNITWDVDISSRESVEKVLESVNPGGLDIEKVLTYMYENPGIMKRGGNV